MQKMLWIFIGISGFVAVLMGAAAAHWLAATMETADILRIEKAATYQMYHTLALLVLASCCSMQSRCIKTSALCFAAGIIFFSGSLYAYSVTHLHGLVFITPIGGISFMLGWLALTVYGARKQLQVRFRFIKHRILKPEGDTYEA